MNFNYNIDKVLEINNKQPSSKNNNWGTQNIFNKKQCEVVIKNIIEYYKKTEINLSQEDVLIILTKFLQRGGSNKNAQNNITIVHVTATEKTVHFNAEILITILKQINEKATIRQFAKGICNEIAQIAMILKIPGDLSNKIKFDYPNISEDELAWASNFQTQNPNCPELIRNWLVKNFEKRFLK